MPRRIAPILTLLALAPSLGAQPRRAPDPTYRVEQLTTNNGLPQNTVAAMVQTADGYLWIATFDGLARYDGVAFTTFDRGTTPEMKRTQFGTLTLDSAGALWAGTDAGLLRYRDGHFTWHNPGTTAEAKLHPANPRYQPDFVPRPESRWLVRNDSLIPVGGGGRRARHIAIDPSAHGGIRDFSLAGDPFLYAGEDRDGNVWLVARSLIVRYDGRAFKAWTGAELLGIGDVRSAFVDREGTLWVGTNDAGLFRVTPRVLTSYSVEEGLLARVVYPVAEDGAGRIWLSSRNVITRWEAGRFSGWRIVRTGADRYELRPASSTDVNLTRDGISVRAMSRARDGALWLCLDGAVVRVEGNRITRTIPLGAEAADVVHIDQAGDIWIATRKLRRVHGDSITVFDESNGYPPVQLHVIMEDSKGRLWLGSRNGLLRRDGERFTPVVRDSGSAGGPIVRSLYEDSTGAVWAGTFDAGLIRLRGDSIARITTTDGLFSNGVFQMLEDGRGQLWMSGNRGIFRVSLRQLSDFANGEIPSVTSVPYGARDGMRSSEANGGRPPAGVRARDGRLWFPTIDGVVVVDPKVVPLGARPPITAISRLEVDGAPRALSGGTIRLEPGEQNLSVEYTAPTSISPGQIHFRYKLATGEAPWVEAGTGRQVLFSNLRPGNYTFSVVASSSEGAWAAEPTTIAVVVEPHFWQTAWFKALAALLLGGAAISIYKIRVRGLKEQERRLTAQVKARTAELAEANERLLQLAIADGLTGLANKRRFDEFLAAEWHRAMRGREPVALLAIDVDHFKKYNDTYGHPAGDSCLRDVGAVLAASVRANTDLAARPGGEEFAVVLTNTGDEGARVVAEKIRLGVETLSIAHRASGVAPVVTVSIGVTATVPAEGGSPGHLVAAADKALYAAKAAGRNQVR